MVWFWITVMRRLSACGAAGRVYHLPGGEGLETDQMPLLDQPIRHALAFHIRTGKHAVTEFDWE
jgi:hypothetical protein